MKVGLLIALLLSALVAACAAPPQPQTNSPPILDDGETLDAASAAAQTFQIVLENGNLLPVDLEINPGDTVEWVNKDAVRYTLLLGEAEERLPVGGTVEYPFAEPGMVRYTAIAVEENSDAGDQRELHGTIIVG